MTIHHSNGSLLTIPAPEIVPAPITNEYGQALYEYWIERRGGAIVPARSAISPASILDLLPRIHILNRKDNGTFLWRLVGTELVDFFGRDPTGEVFDPPATPRHDRRFHAVYRAICSQPCGAVMRSRVRTVGVRVVVLEMVALPLLDSRGECTKILVHSEPLGLGHLNLRHVCRIIEMRMETVDLFDIGAGIPPSTITWPLSGLESRSC